MKTTEKTKSIKQKVKDGFDTVTDKFYNGMEIVSYIGGCYAFGCMVGSIIRLIATKK